MVELSEQLYNKLSAIAALEQTSIEELLDEILQLYVVSTRPPEALYTPLDPFVVQ